MKGRKVSALPFLAISAYRKLTDIWIGWNCCKPRVLTFDEFLSIPPCTTGKHSTIDDTPVPVTKPASEEDPVPSRPPKPIDVNSLPERAPQAPQAQAPPPPPEPESEDDDPSLPILPNTTCRRRGCGSSSTASTSSSREGEECVYHPGYPVFHEGSKGWTCCKKRVLEFDEFMRMKGCQTKEKHMYVGSGKKEKAKQEGVEEKLETVK
jgi:hypothetical protein